MNNQGMNTPTPPPASPPTTPPADPLIARTAPLVRKLRETVETVVVGQDYMVSRLLVGLLTGGHVLLEGVPGLAKTLTVNTLARAIHADFSRIQFTPDLLPADLVGTLIYDPRDHSFTPRKGPVFANIVLADEINRAPAKVQSALLEAMQERNATIGDTTHPMPDPFLVLATQNPIEQEGTYPLPEAQIDRFMLKLRVTYPSKAEERLIVDRMANSTPDIEIEPVATLDDIRQAQLAVDRVFVDDRIKDYVVDLVHATRDPSGLNSAMDLPKLIEYGASPRASISLVKAARAFALLEGRDFVSPADIKSIGLDVLRHRVLLTYEAEAEGLTSEDIVREIFDRVRIP
ncbi:MAG: MoxR-like ATPase [Phycisphaerales bacterium]|jgi:MoxR-like ATPase